MPSADSCRKWRAESWLWGSHHDRSGLAVRGVTVRTGLQAGNSARLPKLTVPSLGVKVYGFYFLCIFKLFFPITTAFFSVYILNISHLDYCSSILFFLSSFCVLVWHFL